MALHRSRIRVGRLSVALPREQQTAERWASPEIELEHIKEIRSRTLNQRCGGGRRVFRKRIGGDNY